MLNDTEECLRCRREQYRFRKDRETLEEAERRSQQKSKMFATLKGYNGAEETHKNQKCTSQYINLRPRVRCNTFIDLNVISIMTSIVGGSLRLFLRFEQQQRGSAHQHTLSLINHDDASDSEDIDECEWRSMSEGDDQG